jgi:hypothetical protein
MLGSHNFMTSNDGNNLEREIGIKTNNLQIISELIGIYDRPLQPNVNQFN